MVHDDDGSITIIRNFPSTFDKRLISNNRSDTAVDNGDDATVDHESWEI